MKKLKIILHSTEGNVGEIIERSEEYARQLIEFGIAVELKTSTEKHETKEAKK
jgi:hypothetical protein